MKTIKTKEVSEIIDEILDRLKKTKKLSKSEKKFLKAHSNDGVVSATVPNLTGNFFADMANPHNIGTMWLDRKGQWNILKTYNEETIDNLEKNEDSDAVWEFKNKISQEEYIEKFPELKQLLDEYVEILIKNQNSLKDIHSKIEIFKREKCSKEHNLKDKLYYCDNLSSIENQFGHVLPQLKFDDNGYYKLIKNK